jgi:ATP-binding cassette subfamily B protein
VPEGDELGRRAGWDLLRSTLAAERRALILGSASGLLWTVCKILVPLFAGYAVDDGIVGHEHGALVGWAVALAVVGLVQAVTTGLRRFQAFSIAYRIETDLRQRLFAHLQRLHFAYHDRAQTGQLLARAASDLQQINNFNTLIPISIANATIVSTVTVILLVINWRLAVLTLVALPLLIIVARRFAGRIHPASLKLQSELAELSVLAEETVSGVRVVKGFGAEPEFAGRMRNRAGSVYDRAVDVIRIRGNYLPPLDFVPAIGVTAVVWYGGHQVLDHHLTVGQLTTFYLFVLALINPLRMTGMLVAQAGRAVAAGQRIQQILATEPAIVDAPKPVPLPPGNGGVRFEDVSFDYGGTGSANVLDGFDITIAPGEAVALVGGTASGKTTAAKLLPRFYDVSGGRILLDGQDIRDLRVRDLRRAVSIVFEDTFLFTDTVRDNIAFAHPEASDSEVERAARLAGAHEFIVDLEDGYNTVIGERGFSLSGGQRQRLALARAIIADPRVLILDDATSAVDPTKEHEIRGALQQVMAGRTTIVIAHRPATIALASRVILLAEGRVVAEGTHESLLATSAAYREVLARSAPDDVPTNGHGFRHSDETTGAR